jgi:hypothetical protein
VATPPRSSFIADATSVATAALVVSVVFYKICAGLSIMKGILTVEEWQCQQRYQHLQHRLRLLLMPLYAWLLLLLLLLYLLLLCILYLLINSILLHHMVPLLLHVLLHMQLLSMQLLLQMLLLLLLLLLLQLHHLLLAGSADPW